MEVVLGLDHVHRAGVMVSNAYAGLASGFQQADDQSDRRPARQVLIKLMAPPPG
jgi:hypothetical protein